MRVLKIVVLVSHTHPLSLSSNSISSTLSTIFDKVFKVEKYRFLRVVKEMSRAGGPASHLEILGTHAK